MRSFKIGGQKTITLFTGTNNIFNPNLIYLV